MRLITKISQEQDNFTLCVKSLFIPPPDSVLNEVAFISQFASPQWAEKFLKDGLPKASDENWHLSGATTIKEYEKWVTTTCGMACTSMIVDFYTKKKYHTIELAKDAFVYDVYQEHQGELSSMRYKEYVDWVKSYGVSAVLYSRLSVAGIKYILAKGGLVIVSVNPNIRGYTTAPEKQVGGHLVLVTGYDNKNNTLTIHNPSGFVSLGTHCGHTLQVQKFKEYFAGRGIGLQKSN